MADTIPQGSRLNTKVALYGSDDGTTARLLKTDATGAMAVGASALPTGASTEANQGKDKVKTISGTVANYAGAEIEITGLEASTPYYLLSVAYRLTGGSAGNTTQPSIGEATGFTQGGMDDRYKVSVAIDKDDDRTIDNLIVGVPVVSDANGKLYIKGASPAAADSTLYWRVDLAEQRSA